MNDIFIVSLDNSDKLCIIDAEDAPLITKFNWRLNKHRHNSFYAVRKGKRTTQMHHMFLKPHSGLVVDHRNFNTLDNRKFNLKLVTESVNCHRRQVPDGKSKYRGVSYLSGEYHKKRWKASIQHCRRSKYIGVFETEEQAALAYNKWALHYYKEDAMLNEIL